jgi:cysteine/O-acetylserine efflux protein
MGILYGYKNSLRYLLGIVAGFFVVMLICGAVSSALVDAFPDVENVLRLVGAGYILWLAYHTFKASYAFREDQQAMAGFSRGFFLQLLNPKVIVYGLTLYSSFLSDIVKNPLYLLLSGAALALVGFGAVSTWALFGAAIRSYLKNPRVTQVLNTVLALLLVWTAIELSGLPEMLKTWLAR